MSFDPRRYREAIRALNSTRPLGPEEQVDISVRCKDESLPDTLTNSQWVNILDTLRAE